MSLFNKLIRALLPHLASDLIADLLADLRGYARSQVVEVVVRQVARIVTKGIDGLVLVFARRLQPSDAQRLTHGVLDEFCRQMLQLVESLRVYADAAYQAAAAIVRKEDEASINGLRGVRERLRRDVEQEFRDVFAVLTGGTPED